MRNNYGAGWELIKAAVRLGEITAPSLGQIPADSLAFYAKDRSGTSSLYFKDDAGVEHDLGALTSAAALTRVNDTNVTLTLGGTPTTALLQAVSLTLGWSGTLAATRGGTGKAALEDVTAGSTKISLGGTPTGAVVNAFSIDVNQANLDHGSIGGLGDDDHSIYALLLGRSGGQTLIGGTASGDDLTLKSTSNATKGSIFLGTASVYDEVNDRLGIGLTGPILPVQIQRVGGDVGNDSGILADLYRADNNATAFFAVRKHRGTTGSPAAVQSTDNLGYMFFQGQTDTGSGVANGAQIAAWVESNWSSTSAPTYLSLYTTPSGSLSPSERWRIDSTGQLAAAGATSTFASHINIDHTVTISGSPAGSVSVVRVAPVFTINQDCLGINANIFVAPSASITSSYAALCINESRPATSITITQAIGGFYRTDYADVAGAVTTGLALQVGAPLISGALKPTTQIGVKIGNQGATGITTAVALSIDKPTNATGNYYLDFGTADNTDPTGGGGAATGRIACLVGGTLRYIPYY